MRVQDNDTAQLHVAAGSCLTVVAIGASAGGLDALRDFFAAALPDSRIAYVVVTHLPATHVSHMPDLLGRAGALAASQAIDGETIRAGHIHMLPPGVRGGISQGVFILEPLAEQETLPKPIDHFMAALAEDIAYRAVGIVLSGTDHDGTAGLRAIKQAGGLTIVQDPSTAQFPGMPSSALDAGAADMVLVAHQMPAAVRSYLDHVPADMPLDVQSQGSASDKGKAAESEGLVNVLSIVLARTGHDFRWYRPAMLHRRLRRRMGLLQMDHVSDYLALIQKSDQEVEALKGEFLIGVTDFFRDPKAWETIANEVLPALLSDRNPADPAVRVWTPGCATGEESYSIAMLLVEQCEASGKPPDVQVFGTDIDTDALAVARAGSYPESIASTVSPQRLARFFDRRGNRYVVRKQLRDCVLFAPQNLVRDIPFSRLDLVLCRNLLIYFEPSLQERVMDLLHFAIKPGGYLLLGKAESAGPSKDLFEPASRTIRLYRRVGARSHLPGGFLSAGVQFGTQESRSTGGDLDRAAPTHLELVREQLGQRIVTAAVLVDREGRPLYFHGQTARVLEPQGEATLDLVALVRAELRPAVRQVLRQALGERRPCTQAAAFVTTDGVRKVQICVEPVEAVPARGLFLLHFNADAAGNERQGAPTDIGIEAELQDGRRRLAMALEDAERSNQDLRIAGEESLALNEELQSANEELESSKEELESLNEELSTVNSELEEKLSEIARNRDDLANLLSSTHIATVLLDRDMHIRRFTPAACALFSLRPGDEGRLLTDIASQLEDAGFLTDLAVVLETAQAREAEVRSRDGTAFLRRILPFLTRESRVEGVVATFVDITPLRAAAQQTKHLLSVLEDSNDAVISFDAQGAILSWNAGAERIYGYGREEAAAAGLSGLIPPSHRSAAPAFLAEVLQEGHSGPQDAVRLHKDGRTIRVSATVTALRDGRGQIYAMLSTERDLTERIRQESEIHFRRLADDIPALLRVEDAKGNALFVNKAWIDFTGQGRDTLLGEGWLRFMHPEDRTGYLEGFGKAMAEQADFDLDFRMLRKDGIYRWMRLASVPHAGADGAYEGYVALTLDIERRKHAELALMQADRRKDQFLALLAHELRNPLAPIRNAVAILSKMAQPDPRCAWATEVVGRQTNAMARLLDDLLDVARIGRGKVTLAKAPVDVSVLIERAVEVSRPLIEAGRH